MVLNVPYEADPDQARPALYETAQLMDVIFDSFTIAAALLAWADENGVDVNMTRESMTPHFMLDGIEYRAVRYSSHVRNIPILRTWLEYRTACLLYTSCREGRFAER